MKKILIWVVVIAILSGIAGLTVLNPHFYAVRMATFMKTGRMNLAAGDFLSAEESFLMAIHLNPRRVEAYLLLADTYIEKSRGELMYTVQEGDTLESIALARLGAEGLADEILDRNWEIISDRYNLPAGLVITLPLPEGSEPPNYIIDAIHHIRRGLAVREHGRLRERYNELLRLLPDPEPPPDPEPDPEPEPSPDPEPSPTPEELPGPVDPQEPPVTPVEPQEPPWATPDIPGDDEPTEPEDEEPGPDEGPIPIVPFG